MSFFDEAAIYVRSGDGGNGCVAFRRERRRPRGGPAGGRGGRGGDVIVEAAAGLNTLHGFRHRRHFKARRGGNGEGNDRDGANAEALTLRVPAGTTVLDENDAAVVDLAAVGDSAVLAEGGRGGRRGNAAFKTPTRQAPRIAEEGAPGVERRLRLRLRLIADVGLWASPTPASRPSSPPSPAPGPGVADYPVHNAGAASRGRRGRRRRTRNRRHSGPDRGGASGRRGSVTVSARSRRALRGPPASRRRDRAGCRRRLAHRPPRARRIRRGTRRKTLACRPQQVRRRARRRAATGAGGAGGGGSVGHAPAVGGDGAGVTEVMIALADAAGPRRARPRRRLRGGRDRAGGRRRSPAPGASSSRSARRCSATGAAVSAMSGSRRWRTTSQPCVVAVRRCWWCRRAPSPWGGGALRRPVGRWRWKRSRPAPRWARSASAHAWQQAFARHDVPVAQLLLTPGISDDRRRYLNARNTIDALLRLDALPLINENDTVATEEIPLRRQ